MEAWLAPRRLDRSYTADTTLWAWVRVPAAVERAGPSVSPPLPDRARGVPVVSAGAWAKEVAGRAVYFARDPRTSNCWPGSRAKRRNRRAFRRVAPAAAADETESFRHCGSGRVAGPEAGLRGPSGRGRAGKELWPCLEEGQRLEQGVCFEGQLEGRAS